MSQEQIVVRRTPFLNGGNAQEDILKLLDSLEDLRKVEPEEAVVEGPPEPS